MSFGQLCLATEWPKSVLKKGSSKRAPVNPPSTISTALMYEESSVARKSTALATSSGSPQRPCGIAEEKNSVSIRGLNRNHNHDLKNLFKSVATVAAARERFPSAHAA